MNYGPERQTELDVDLVTIEAFGKRFVKILPGLAEDLRSLEREGALYDQFVDIDSDGNRLDTFSSYRIQLNPAEIVEYVEAYVASQQFEAAYRETQDFTAAVLAVQDEKFRKRVTEYDEYGTFQRRFGVIDADLRGCFASFLGPDLEALVCGRRRDRYEMLPHLGSRENQDEIVLSALKSVAVSARRLRNRSHGRPPVEVSSEYDVQDLAELALSAVFQHVEREEWVPQVAGSAKRIDLVIKNEGVVIECKYVRDAAHAKKVAGELQIDFETYHHHPACRRLFAYVYDPDHHIADPESFASDLSGMRKKGDHEFSVQVIVG